MKGARWPGDWKYDCQRCGFTFPSSKIIQEWTGLRVCRDCWEPKHPQLLIKVREETAKPDFVNRDPIDEFVHLCTLQTSSSYADMATADCARADWADLSYQTLVELNENGHE